MRALPNGLEEEDEELEDLGIPSEIEAYFSPLWILSEKLAGKFVVYN